MNGLWHKTVEKALQWYQTVHFFFSIEDYGEPSPRVSSCRVGVQG